MMMPEMVCKHDGMQHTSDTILCSKLVNKSAEKDVPTACQMVSNKFCSSDVHKLAAKFT